MSTTNTKRTTPSYGAGFDGLSGLTAKDTSHRWYSARSLLFAGAPSGASRP